jgi:hypothetical protein
MNHFKLSIRKLGQIYLTELAISYEILFTETIGIFLKGGDGKGLR